MDNAKVKKMKNEQAKKRSKIYDLDHTSQRNFSKKVWQSLYFLNNSNHYAEKKSQQKNKITQVTTPNHELHTGIAY